MKEGPLFGEEAKSMPSKTSYPYSSRIVTLTVSLRVTLTVTIVALGVTLRVTVLNSDPSSNIFVSGSFRK